VATYGQIARLLGVPRSARVVGWAMHGNPHGARVPWQRVVQRGGSLSATVSPADPGRQRRLLEREGVTFLLDGRIEAARSDIATRRQDLADSRADLLASMDGLVPDTLSYEECLKTKPESFQLEILGPTKHRLWKKSKLAFTDMVDQSHNPLTISELQRKHGL